MSGFKVNHISILKWLLFSGWIVLFVGGVAHYSGSWFAYTAFSFVFLALLISGFSRQISYGYLFLVLMLWLGFWFKLTIHTLIDFSFGEPVGLFESAPTAWDEVLWISTIGGAGVLVGRFIYSMINHGSTMVVPIANCVVPDWYISIRRWVWTCVFIVCLSVTFANAKFGILQIGLAPHTILIWPFNALISWTIGYGFALVIAAILWWDIILGRKISVVVYFIFFEAFTTAISMLSRGSYIFHVAPQLLALYKNRNHILGWSWLNTIMISAVFVVLFAVSNPVVNALRDYFYYGDTSIWFWDKDMPNEPIPKPSIIKKSEPIDELDLAEKAFPANEPKHNLWQFAIDRWIGIEGVMAVSAFPKKSGGLFSRALTERAEIGKSNVYQKVCQSHYRHMDMDKYQFNSLPGAVAFFFLSGYWYVVGVGMLILTLMLLSSEQLVGKITENPILAALWGGAVANSIVQFGVNPRGLLIYYLEFVCAIGAIAFVQSKYFSSILKRVRIA